MTEKPGNWGRWGDDDERGALNLITPEIVCQAARACRTGKVYALSIPIQRSGMPNFDYRGIPQRLTLTNKDDEHMAHANGAPEGTGVCEDILVFATHTATHMDALGHIYAENTTYNGFSNDFSPYDGATRLGIDKVGAVAGRGVLIDVAKAKGVDALEPGYVITAEDLSEALAAEGTQLQPGDLVLVRTGWLQAYLGAGAELLQQPGLGIEAAEFLASQDVAVVGADNSAIEAIPPDRGLYLPVHVALLVKYGIHLLEHLDLAELSADSCYEFLLNLGPLKVTGASGSPITPIAIG